MPPVIVLLPPIAIPSANPIAPLPVAVIVPPLLIAPIIVPPSLTSIPRSTMLFAPLTLIVPELAMPPPTLPRPPTNIPVPSVFALTAMLPVLEMAPDWVTTKIPIASDFALLTVIEPTLAIPPEPTRTSMSPREPVIGMSPMIVPELTRPPREGSPATSIAKAFCAPVAVIVPLFRTPPPTELLITASPVTLPLTPTLPGVIVPALVTAPVTVDPVITIDVVEWPAGLVTVATVWPVIACPAGAGVARRSAATEVVARSAGMQVSAGARLFLGTRSSLSFFP